MYLNDNLDIAPFKSVLVILLTTNLKGGRFKFPIDAREKLEKDALSELKKKLDFILGYFD